MVDGMRRRRAGGQKRRVVLEHVVEVVVARGYHHTRFQDVAAASGVAISTLQSYFGSREDMLVEALSVSTNGEVAVMRELASGNDQPWDRLVALIDRGLRTPVPVWRMLMEFWSAAAHDEELREHSLRLQSHYREPFLAELAQGTTSGAFVSRHDPEAIVDVIVATLDGLLYPRVLRQPRPDLDPMRAVLLEQLELLLGIRK